MIEIIQAETYEQIAEAKSIFREYESWLGLSLCFQHFEDELQNLPGKYALPDGRLYLAYSDNKVVGCIALRKLDSDICEMKRLFLRESARGNGAGKQLIKQLIADASEIGYKKMRLDTFPPKMAKAVNLYKSYGFHVVDAYYDNPYEGVLFMELDL